MALEQHEGSKHEMWRRSLCACQLIPVLDSTEQGLHHFSSCYLRPSDRRFQQFVLLLAGICIDLPRDSGEREM